MRYTRASKLERLIISDETRPKLAVHVRIQFEPRRGKYALLSPEKVMWPDDISLDILRLCDGMLSASEIISKLATDYDAPEEVVGPDVRSFLQEWSDKMLVIA